MNLAVKFYKDHPRKPIGMPDDWPWECREIGSATSYDREPGPWIVVSRDEYVEFVDANDGVKQAYNNEYLGENKQPHPVMSWKGIYIRVREFLGLTPTLQVEEPLDGNPV